MLMSVLAVDVNIDRQRDTFGGSYINCKLYNYTIHRMRYSKDIAEDAKVYIVGLGKDNKIEVEGG